MAGPIFFLNSFTSIWLQITLVVWAGFINSLSGRILGTTKLRQVVLLPRFMDGIWVTADISPICSYIMFCCTKATQTPLPIYLCLERCLLPLRSHTIFYFLVLLHPSQQYMHLHFIHTYILFRNLEGSSEALKEEILEEEEHPLIPKYFTALGHGCAPAPEPRARTRGAKSKAWIRLFQAHRNSPQISGSSHQEEGCDCKNIYARNEDFIPVTNEKINSATAMLSLYAAQSCMHKD